MQRARRLLRAYSILNNTPTFVVSHMSGVVIYIVGIACVLINLVGILIHESQYVNNHSNLSYLSIIIVLLIIRSIYTGFFEDRRKGTKNNLRELTIHLPISRKDFILAQYIGSLYLFAPAFILTICLIMFNLLAQANDVYRFNLGVIILFFNITYSVICLEKGILTCCYIDPRIREMAYLSLTFAWMGVNYMMESGDNQILFKMIVEYHEQLWLHIFCNFGGMGGILLTIVALVGGYLSSVKLPAILERRK